MTSVVEQVTAALELRSAKRRERYLTFGSGAGTGRSRIKAGCMHWPRNLMMRRWHRNRAARMCAIISSYSDLLSALHRSGLSRAAEVLAKAATSRLPPGLMMISITQGGVRPVALFSRDLIAQAAGIGLTTASLTVHVPGY
jgi:phosphogluconate dehydratase